MVRITKISSIDDAGGADYDHQGQNQEYHSLVQICQRIIQKIIHFATPEHILLLILCLLVFRFCIMKKGSKK